MPAYTWLAAAALDRSHIEGKILTLRRLGVPYPDGYERQAEADLSAQAARIAARLQASGLEVAPDREIIALIAYLQRLGTDIAAKDPSVVAGGSR
jgi:cytochrome c oxidase cbb3-type subunit I/II